jgi:hypothetical protein
LETVVKKDADSVNNTGVTPPAKSNEARLISFDLKKSSNGSPSALGRVLGTGTRHFFSQVIS